MKYEVITDVSKDGVIVQRLVEDKVRELSRWVCDTRESAIIKSLIKLGWTPPNKNIEPTTKGRGGSCLALGRKEI